MRWIANPVQVGLTPTLASKLTRVRETVTQESHKL
jgi:hypothetical protein